MEDPVTTDVDRDVVRAAGTRVAEEDQVTGLLVGPGDALSEADLVAGVVGEPDATARGLVRGVQNESGAIEASAGRAVEVATSPDVRLAELRRGGLDQVSREAGWEVGRRVVADLRARERGVRETPLSVARTFSATGWLTAYLSGYAETWTA